MKFKEADALKCCKARGLLARILALVTFLAGYA